MVGGATREKVQDMRDEMMEEVMRRVRQERRVQGAEMAGFGEGQGADAAGPSCPQAARQARRA